LPITCNQQQEKKQKQQQVLSSVASLLPPKKPQNGLPRIFVKLVSGEIIHEIVFEKGQIIKCSNLNDKFKYSYYLLKTYLESQMRILLIKIQKFFNWLLFLESVVIFLKI